MLNTDSEHSHTPMKIGDLFVRRYQYWNKQGKTETTISPLFVILRVVSPPEKLSSYGIYDVLRFDVLRRDEGYHIVHGVSLDKCERLMGTIRDDVNIFSCE